MFASNDRSSAVMFNSSIKYEEQDEFKEMIPF